MVGGESAYWTDEDFPFVFTEKANGFIEENKDNPFFLFFSFHDIHVPRLPNERFQGKSGMGPRGDAIVQMDWITGQILDKLEQLDIDDNTLVIFTSDNGPVLNDGYEDMAVEMLGSHLPTGQYSGGKYSALEGGTRVPTIVRWPESIQPGESEALVSQTDIIASLAALVDVQLQEDEAIDSQNHLDAFMGKQEKAREFLLEESFTLSLRMDNWKYVKPVPENKKYPGWLANKKIETGFVYEPQLFNLTKDISERVNVANDHPEILEEMERKLDEIEQKGSSQRVLANMK
jgi:arylsulfatase A-like enzyme